MSLKQHGTCREKIWDHAAGVVIFEEAGGLVTDGMGRKLDFGLGRCDPCVRLRCCAFIQMFSNINVICLSNGDMIVMSNRTDDMLENQSMSFPIIIRFAMSATQSFTSTIHSVSPPSSLVD